MPWDKNTNDPRVRIGPGGIMSVTFETCGNAIIIVRVDGRPILATDPWLVGSCYFGSWMLDKPLTETQIRDIQSAEYVWISHGHPDHLHPDSLDMLPPGKRVLVPDHYHPEIHDMLVARGFEVQNLGYRKWFVLSPEVRICCVDNPNQDAILVVETGQGILINKNDSPFCGEFRFLRGLVRKWPRERTYLAALCAIDADMKNIVDAAGDRVIEPPSAYKMGAIWATAREADRLGVGSFCCSSSQHIYVRADSVWANDYRIVWSDMKRHWARPDVRLIQPYATVDMDTREVTLNHPEQTSNTAAITGKTNGDDWQETLDDAEWRRVEAFFTQFETLVGVLDFVDFTVGGERRSITIGFEGQAKPSRKRRGLHFQAPKSSLMTAVEYGFFDDLLIGNFMKTELINMALYPDFTPLVAKYGGNAKVLTKDDLHRFHRRYLRRNPYAYLAWRLRRPIDNTVLPLARAVAIKLGVGDMAKRIYRLMLGDPV